MKNEYTKKICLSSGFVFDYSNILGAELIEKQEVDSFAERLSAAHAAVSKMRTTGEVKGHLSKDGIPEAVLFPQLPYIKEGNINSPTVIRKLQKFGRSIRNRVDTIISFGIGGSFLGNKVLFDVTCGDFWNLKSQADRQGYPKLFFSGNNIDPRRTYELSQAIIAEAKTTKRHGRRYKVLLIVISKSGATLDTMSTFMVAYEVLQGYKELMDLEVVAVTDPAEGDKETLLHRLATSESWPIFAVPDGVGGRFSVFSEVGLITGACIGFDIEAFLQGACDMDKACQKAEVWSNPAMLNAVLKYLAATQHGRNIEVFMPYADYLKSTAEWYIQLLAESLGKRCDRDGKGVYYGRTPIVAVGTTDMHAQTQLHQDGAKDKVVQFVKVNNWKNDPLIPNIFCSEEKLTDIAGITLSQALEAAREANAEALLSDSRFNASFIMPELSAYHLGELLFLLAMSIAYEGELANVDAFDQPGVEAYKRILGPKLNKLAAK